MPYDVVEVVIAARPVAGVRALVARGHVGQEFGRHLDQLTVDFCVGVTAPFVATGAVVPLETPGGTAAMTTHYGDYSALGDANAGHSRPVPRPGPGPRGPILGSVRALACRSRAATY